MQETKTIIPVGSVQQRILLIRGEKVIVDADLAEFYGVSTRRLNEQVKRNSYRFPQDFMFRLVPEEKAQVISICDHLSKLKFSKTLPNVFTEHGAIMAASVLNSERAVEVGVFIVRAFVALRRAVSEHKELADKISQLERRVTKHDQHIVTIVQAIRELSSSRPIPKHRRIGFHSDES